MCVNSSLPLANDQNIPLVLETQDSVQRSYTNSNQIINIAIDEYKKYGKGLTYISLQDRGLSKTKRQAQKILKYHLKRGVLFALSDKRPQEYYPSCLRSEIFKKELQKNTPIDPIGVSLLNASSISSSPLGVNKSKHPLSQCIEYMSYYTLKEYVLPLLPEAPLLVHNLTLKTKIILGCYSELDLPSYKNNNGKYHEEIIGKTKVDYILYSSGTVVIHTSCSNYPFRVETEQDRLRLVAFFGQTRDRLIHLLNDRHERIVDDISEWEVTECDLNKDIKISDLFHLTALKIRIKHLDHLLGIYVKAMGRDTVLRVEETKRPNARLVDFITDTFNPMERFQCQLLDQRQKINEIYDIITKSLATQGSTKNGEGVL
jgi:hypothetical protein